MNRLFRKFKMKLGRKVMALSESLLEIGSKWSLCSCLDDYFTDNYVCCDDCEFNSGCACCSGCSNLVPEDDWVEVPFTPCGDCG